MLNRLPKLINSLGDIVAQRPFLQPLKCLLQLLNIPRSNNNSITLLPINMRIVSYPTVLELANAPQDAAIPLTDTPTPLSEFPAHPQSSPTPPAPEA